MQLKAATRFSWILVLAVTLGRGSGDQVWAQTAPSVDHSAAGMGRSTYRSYCATCHGGKGKGDGPLAEHLRIPPTDITRISQQNEGKFPFDEIVKIIDGRQAVRTHGSQDMPIWGDTFLKTGTMGSEEKATAKIRQLAHFIWSLQDKSPAPPPEPSEPAAPDASEAPAPTPEPSEPPPAPR